MLQWIRKQLELAEADVVTLVRLLQRKLKTGPATYDVIPTMWGPMLMPKKQKPIVMAKPAAKQFLEQHAFGDGREETIDLEAIRRELKDNG